jgi:hypothetical protein
MAPWHITAFEVDLPNVNWDTDSRQSIARHGQLFRT